MLQFLKVFAIYHKKDLTYILYYPYQSTGYLENTMNWQKLFWDKCREINDLKQELHLLKTILRSYIPIIGNKGNNDERINN